MQLRMIINKFERHCAMRFVAAIVGILGLIAPAMAAPRLATAMPETRPVALAADEQADDAGYLFRLGLMEGHLVVARELIQAGRPKLALPHFGHPVRELYDDIADDLKAKKVPPFDTKLIELEALATGSPSNPALAAKYDEVMDAIQRARDAAPKSMRDSVPAMIRICADTVETAAGEYGQAVEKGRIENLVEYHDSRGYLAYVSRELERLSAGADADGKTMIERFRLVLAKAQAIVAPLIPPEQPITPVSEYRAVAAEAKAISPP